MSCTSKELQSRWFLGWRRNYYRWSFSMSFYASHYCFHVFVFQCGLSRTDVNNHSTRVCVCVCVWGVDHVHMKLKQRVLTSVLHDVKAFDHFHFSFVICHWSLVLILSRHLRGRCVCVFVGSGLNFCSPKGISVTENKLNINKKCELSIFYLIFFISRTNQKCQSYLLFWKLYMANWWI